jgi:hypothetical protein
LEYKDMANFDNEMWETEQPEGIYYIPFIWWEGSVKFFILLHS